MIKRDRDLEKYIKKEGVSKVKMILKHLSICNFHWDFIPDPSYFLFFKKRK
jgi:hypothetical protein